MCLDVRFGSEYDIVEPVTSYTHKSRLQATLLSMGNSQQVVATGWHKAGILGGWIATFLLAAWILIPRLVIGTEVPIAMGTRSEEHTSALESRFEVVCRRLLDKENR